MSETELCFQAEITCGGVAFQTEAAFISISENNNFTYLSASKIIRLRYCCQSFPIKPSAFTGCSGKLSYQYVICFLQTSHDQIWQQKHQDRAIFYTSSLNLSCHTRVCSCFLSTIKTFISVLQILCIKRQREIEGNH